MIFTDHIKGQAFINFLPHPAGGEAASRVGPKIALDHVRVYKK